MEKKRQNLSKKIRFEVFKRDKFTCQYCGRTVPEVILHVDHIHPVARGGKNDILNLITSCKDCNLGKGARELSDESVVEKQRQRLLEIADKEEQLKMMLDWRKELSQIEDKEIQYINDYIGSISDWVANDKGKLTIKKWLKQFKYQEIIESIDIAFEYYYRGTSESWNKAFDKVGGICNNRKNPDKKRYFFNYIKKVCISEFGYYNNEDLNIFVKDMDDEGFENAKMQLKESRNWTIFKNRMYQL